MFIINSAKATLAALLIIGCCVGCTKQKKDYFSQLSTMFLYWKINVKDSKFRNDFIICSVTKLASKKSDLKDIADLKVKYTLPSGIEKVSGDYNNKKYTTEFLKRKIILDSSQYKFDFFHYGSNTNNIDLEIKTKFSQIKYTYIVAGEKYQPKGIALGNASD